MNNAVVSYTNTSVNTHYLWATTDTTSKDVWVDRPPKKTIPIVFLSPDIRSEEALSPNDRIWDEIDTMLASVWADKNILTIEEDDETISTMQMSELIRFEKLYGESDGWE